MRVPSEDAEAMLVSLIAFSSSAVEALLALTKGDPLAVVGRASLKSWEKDGRAAHRSFRRRRSGDVRVPGRQAPQARHGRAGAADMSSPTQRSLDLLRERGYTAAVVERWNPWAKIRQDLFGCIDVLAVGNGETLAVQACHYSDVSKRLEKIANAEAIPAIRSAGWRLTVMGWRKVRGRWTVREVDAS
jgi:hypothetical protein